MLISKYGERNKPKMRKLLTPTPKVEAENNGFYRGACAKSELEMMIFAAL